MADSAPTTNDVAAQPAADAAPAVSTETKHEDTLAALKEETKREPEAAKTEEKAAEESKPEKSSETKTEPATETTEKPAGAAADGDVEMKDAPATSEAQSGEAAPAAATPSKSNNNRRKSGAGESKGKSLSRKGSKAKLTHTDAKPGDHFLIKLRGFPPWPAVICDEDMLPPALLNNRPVSAARADGTYAEAYADGGKRIHDRTFPVMYLFTNEFGWEKNMTLTELSGEKAKNAINDKQRKDLKAAYELAAEQHPIEYYKDNLKKIEEEQAAIEEEIRQAEIQAAEAAAAAAATPKKTKKAKAKGDGEDGEAGSESAAKSKSKKRKAEDEASTPQRSDSTKKPKIKLNTSTPKSASSSAKDTKAAQAKKEAAEKQAKEAKLTPEQRRERKQKEVLYLRHKLQKGLLTGPPAEAEMKPMSEYLGILEKFSGLEGSMIRSTKINKVLRAILKMDTIPLEAEYNFKKRSQALLDNWATLLASAAAAAPATGSTNGVNGSATPAAESKDSKADAKTESSKLSEEPKPSTEQAAEATKTEAA